MTKIIPRCSCIICKEEKSSKGIFTHYIIAHTDYKEKHQAISINARIEATKIIALNAENRRLEYANNPAMCTECNNVLSYDNRLNKFCSHSCSATLQNRNSIGKTKVESNEAKQSRIDKVTAYHTTYCRLYRCKACNTNHSSNNSKKLCELSHKPVKPIRKRQRNKKINKNVKPDICGSYTPLRSCICRHCKTQFLSKTSLQYCNIHRDEATNKRAFYKFRFSLYDYPALFNLTLLKQVGFYGPGGKCKRWNKDGLSRDHRVSVSDAIKHNYDQYYITHPMNCELMPQTQNDIKKGQSSITYEELIILVDNFDKVNSEA